MVIQARKHQTRLLACLLPYPCQIRSHRFFTPCIVPVFPLSRSTHRGDLRSAGISRFFATPLRLTGPHHSRRGLLLPSFHIGQDTRVLADDSPRAPGSSLAWLLVCRCTARCCLRPRGVGSALVRIALTTWPAPYWKGSAHSQNHLFSGLCVRFRATPFTSLSRLSSFPARAFSR